MAFVYLATFPLYRDTIQIHTTKCKIYFSLQIMWSRNSPFTLISIGGIRHSKDPRFWVEKPNVNKTSKQSWVSLELEN